MDFMINYFGHNIFKKYDQNNLFIVKSKLKIIIGLHVLKLIQKHFECFTSVPNAHGTF